MNESLQPFIHQKMLVLHQDVPATVAARAMMERSVGCAVIADHHGHIVGVVTDRDLTCQLLAFELPYDTPISDVMTGDILTVSENAILEDAIKIMETGGIRRVPVVSQSPSGRQKCVGIITLDDLLLMRKIGADTLSRIVRSQILRRIRSLSDGWRSERRKEQTLNRFNKIMAENLHLEKNLAETLTFHLLKDVVKRLSFTEASHFITQIPNLLQEDLLNLPAGPDTSITADSITKNLCERFQVSRETAVILMRGFWAGLSEFLNERSLNHVMAQFPSDMKRLFSGERAA